MQLFWYLALWRVLVNTSGVASLRQQVHATKQTLTETKLINLGV